MINSGAKILAKDKDGNKVESDKWKIWHKKYFMQAREKAESIIKNKSFVPDREINGWLYYENERVEHPATSYAQIQIDRIDDEDEEDLFYYELSSDNIRLREYNLDSFDIDEYETKLDMLITELSKDKFEATEEMDRVADEVSGIGEKSLADVIARGYANIDSLYTMKEDGSIRTESIYDLSRTQRRNLKKWLKNEYLYDEEEEDDEDEYKEQKEMVEGTIFEDADVGDQLTVDNGERMKIEEMSYKASEMDGYEFAGVGDENNPAIAFENGHTLIFIDKVVIFADWQYRHDKGSKGVQDEDVEISRQSLV